MAQERSLGNKSELTFSELFAGGGEMGAIMRSTDWSKTKLGPVETWPRSLRTMLGVVLGSRFPMLLWWGPDLLHLYNDAYRPILRDKHPASLAAPAAQVWAEVWDVAGPMARSVQEGGPATWTEDLQLFIASGSMAEETYFTFSYSPVPGDDGRVGGLLNTVQETTAKVQGERQIRMLHDLAARAAEAKSETAAYGIATEVLSANELDLPFVLLYVLNEQGDEAQLVAASGWKDYDGPAKLTHVPINDAGTASWPFAQALRTADEVIVGDLTSRFGPLPKGSWNARPEQAVVLPLARAGQPVPYAFLVAGISPHRALDGRYRAFFRATADQVGNVMANARAYDAEKKRAEALAEIDRAKTDFFSNVSHEFRTPLTLILGPLEAAMARPEGSLSGDDLKAVHRSGIRLLRLVNSLLDFTRIEAGRLQLSFEPTDLARLTIELASAFDSLVERARLKLIVHCPLLPEPVYVDRSQWEKIVLNLVSNAFKFTFEGEIEVSLTWRGDHAELRVRDTGTGIPAQELPHIFERFYRVPQARGRSFEGTGIGLSLVQELVKLHGGSVSAASVQGQGTTFVVSIPGGSAHLPADQIVHAHDLVPPAVKASSYVLEATQWLPREDAAKRQPARHPVEHQPALALQERTTPVEVGRILVVDDNADMRAYLCRLLRPLWEVEAVGDGQAALASARVRPPDLILSDVMMPGLDGFALLRELRTDSKTSTVPVILLSARAGEEAVLEGLDRGADDYLAKPFTAQELHARVRTHLTMARARNALNAELARANQDLEAFSYSVAHDLRAPLRGIDGFSSLLLFEHGAALDDSARKLLDRVRTAARRMGQMIDDLLMLSRVARTESQRAPVDLSALAQEVLERLRTQEPDRSARIELESGVVAHGDPGLLRIALENLLGNAWKYSSRKPEALIEFGVDRQSAEKGESVYFVRDNGAGFDMEHADKLFTPFQRLHRNDEYPGTGIGLATVQRIVHKCGGRIWVEAEVGRGATFYFTLS